MENILQNHSFNTFSLLQAIQFIACSLAFLGLLISLTGCHSGSSFSAVGNFSEGGALPVYMSSSFEVEYFPSIQNIEKRQQKLEQTIKALQQQSITPFNTSINNTATKAPKPHGSTLMPVLTLAGTIKHNNTYSAIIQSSKNNQSQLSTVHINDVIANEQGQRFKVTTISKNSAILKPLFNSKLNPVTLSLTQTMNFNRISGERQ